MRCGCVRTRTNSRSTTIFKILRALIQRVTNARVEVDGAITGRIDTGLVVLLGVTKTDTQADADYLVDKIANLRIFSDDAGKMNLSLLNVGGSLLVVSQFTLYGDCRKGRRPGFDLAASAEQARALYEYFVEKASSQASVWRLVFFRRICRFR